MPTEPKETSDFRIRPATADDLAQVMDLDQVITGTLKDQYWSELYSRYKTRRPHERFFFVAEAGETAADKSIIGFIIGEVRAWEFGSAPCGWVSAISVDTTARQKGIGNALLEKISVEFKKIGVTQIRTMVSMNNHLLLSFFRSEGLTAGTYLQLEKDLDD